MTEQETDNHSGIIQSVVLAFQVMDLLANNNRPVGVGEIAQRLGIGKSRVFRHLQTLCSAGYAAQDLGSDKYMPGGAWSVLSARAANGAPLRWIAETYLTELAAVTGHTAAIVQFEGAGCRTVGSVAANARISVALPSGALMPAHATAFGKIGLAFARPEWIERFNTGSPTAFTAHTLVDSAALTAEINRVRERGWATSHAEWVEGVSALAMPVRWGDDCAIAAVGLVAHGRGIEANPDVKMLNAIRSAALAIADSLSPPRRNNSASLAHAVRPSVKL